MNLHMLDSSINDHLHQVIPERDEVLTEMEAYAKERRFPIVGPLVGRVLHQLVLITNPTRIFEMGSGFGYSAYWMAKALRDESAKIICTEGSQDNADRAMGYFQRGGSPIELNIGSVMPLRLSMRQRAPLTSFITISTKMGIHKPSAKPSLVSDTADYSSPTICSYADG